GRGDPPQLGVLARRRRMIVVVMGVAGVGKTTVGKRLAAALGWEFHDADDFHLPENVAKMRAGIALTDDDRAAWLERLRSLVADVSPHMAPERGGGPAVGAWVVPYMNRRREKS